MLLFLELIWLLKLSYIAAPNSSIENSHFRLEAYDDYYNSNLNEDISQHKEINFTRSNDQALIKLIRYLLCSRKTQQPIHFDDLTDPRFDSEHVVEVPQNIGEQSRDNFIQDCVYYCTILLMVLVIAVAIYAMYKIHEINKYLPRNEVQSKKYSAVPVELSSMNESR